MHRVLEGHADVVNTVARWVDGREVIVSGSDDNGSNLETSTGKRASGAQGPHRLGDLRSAGRLDGREVIVSGGDA